MAASFVDEREVTLVEGPHRGHEPDAATGGFRLFADGEVPGDFEAGSAATLYGRS